MLLTNLNNIDDVFDRIFKAEPYIKQFTTTGTHNVEHNEDGTTLTLNVPGYNKKLIDVSVDGDVLVIEGKANSGDAKGFSKRFDMNDTFDVESIKANVVDGVLTLTIPYLEEVKPKKVKVKVN